MPDTITTTTPALARPDVLAGQVIDHLATLARLAPLALSGLREECGAGHEASFDAVDALLFDMQRYGEALRAWAAGQAPRYRCEGHDAEAALVALARELREHYSAGAR
jgi:hypothetical protein